MTMDLHKLYSQWLSSGRAWMAPLLAALTIALVVAAGMGIREIQKNQNMVRFTQYVGERSSLKIRFPEAMDRQSVAENLRWPNDVKGESNWEGDEFVIHPAAPLELNGTYVFEAPAATMKGDGTPLARDLAYTFVVSGMPLVSATIPAPNTADVPVDAHITLVFDRPMIPLGTLDDPSRIPEGWNVSIQPALKGRWRWLSTYSVEWDPEGPMDPATTYTVSIPAGIATEGGEKTGRDFSFSFETKRPRVLTLLEPSGEMGPKDSISLKFNLAMDLASAGSLIKLTRDKAGEVPFAVSYGEKNTGGKKETDQRVLVLKPRSPLPFNSSFTLTVPAGVRGRVGPLGTAEAWTQSVHTPIPMEVKGASWTDDGRLALHFSNSTASGSLQAHVKLKPQPKDFTQALTYGYEDYDHTYFITPDLEPSTTYSLEITPGVQDIYGQTAEKGITYSFTTKPLDPNVIIRSKGTFGIFEKAKPPVFPVSAVNVSQLQVTVAPLAIEKLVAARKDQLSKYADSLELGDLPSSVQKTFPSTAKKNETFGMELDLAKILGGKMQSGLYAVRVEAPEEINPYTKLHMVHTQIVDITNMALTMKTSGDRVLVWATDMTTGEPVRGATVSLRGLDGNVVATGQTGTNGLYQTDVDLSKFPSTYGGMPEFYATAEKDGDLSFVASTWSEGLQPWDFSISGQFVSPGESRNALHAYVYTERPLYGAGDTVHYKGILRLRDKKTGVMTSPKAGSKVFVTITDPEGNNVEVKTLETSPFGSVAGDFTLDAAASLGSYNLGISMNEESGTESYDAAYGSFQVLAYRKPEFRVLLTPKSNDYFSGDAVEADLNASYYFGAPMSNAEVTWRMQTMDYFFNKFTDDYYSFAMQSDWCWYNCERSQEPLTEGKTTLDASGHGTLRIPVSIDDKGVSQIATIEADVTDTNKQVVSTRASVVVHKSKVYVGLKTKEYAVAPGKDVTAQVISLSPEGKPVAGQSVTLQLYSRTWNTVSKEGIDEGYYAESEPVDTLVSTKSVSTGENGKGEIGLTIPSGGEYVIVASTKDASGKQSKASTTVYAWSEMAVNWPQSNNNRMEVTSDKPNYKPGDKAVILVKSPFQGKGVKALVTVERERVMQTKVIDLESAAQPISIDITSDLIPNAYVSVVVVKPRMGETYDKNNADTGMPAFRAGYVSLSVDTSSKKVFVEVLPSKKKTLPGEKMSVTIKTTDASGNAVPAETSLSVVDLSLLALTGFHEPEMLWPFYSDRSLGVQTSTMLQYLIERFKPGSKGGGGGLDGESKQRGDFRDTAFWKANIITNERGEATVNFTLPDNLTTWKLLAIAATKDHRFGASSAEILTTKDVLVRPALPRFAVQGDTFTAKAIVRNDLDVPKTFSVSAKGSGLTLKTKSPQSITLQPGAQQTVPFTVEAKFVSKATVIFRAETDGAVDEVKQSFPIVEAALPVTVATSDEVTGASQEAVSMPRKEDIAEGTVRVTLSRSLLSWLRGGIEYVNTYPYGCAEQIVSSFFGNVVLSELPDAEQITGRSSDWIRQQVNVGLQKVYATQKSDGGFGYYPQSLESDAALTAYVFYALTLTDAARYPVDAGVLNNAASYLYSQMRLQDKDTPYSLATRMQILFALSEAGRPDVNALTAVAKQRKDLPIFARAQLAIALHKSGNATAKKLARTVLDEVLSNAKVDPRGVHFEEKNTDYWSGLYSTNARTTAFVLQALAHIDPEHPLLPQTVQSLLELKKDGHWDTTQSTIASIIALKDVTQARNEMKGNSKGTLRLNGKEIGSAAFSVNDHLAQKEFVLPLKSFTLGSNNSVAIEKEGDGRLYKDITFTYRLTRPEEPSREEGMSINRTVEPLKRGVKGYVTGETYRVTLTITTAQDRKNVAVSSPLPAGFEPIDTSFLTSQQLLAGSQNLGEEAVDEEGNAEEKNWWSYWWGGVFTHTELRNDEAFLFSETLPTGVYRYSFLVRATTAGSFFERPARVWEMYYPEVFGQTQSRTVTVSE